MLCTNCNKNTATVHYSYSNNGKIFEAHLCSECAGKEKIFNFKKSNDDISSGNIFGNIFGDFAYSSLWNTLGAEKNGYIKPKICPFCGMSEDEFRNGGKYGCAKCYGTFASLSEVMLRKLHLSAEYKGKKPDVSQSRISVVNKIEKLKADMQNAVAAQEYEEAAKIRDAIKQLENTSPVKDNDGKKGDE